MEMAEWRRGARNDMSCGALHGDGPSVGFLGDKTCDCRMGLALEGLWHESDTIGVGEGGVTFI